MTLKQKSPKKMSKIQKFPAKNLFNNKYRVAWLILGLSVIALLKLD